MSFTSWLKSVGSKIAGVTGKVEAVTPLVGSLVTAIDPNAAGIVNTFEGAVGAVVSVEGAIQAIGNSTLTGADKAKASGALVAQLIQSAPFMHGKEIADPQKFQGACSSIAGGIADLLNSLKAQG